MVEAETRAGALAALESLGLRAVSTAHLTRLRHEFTHFSLEIEVLKVDVAAQTMNDADCCWEPTDEALTLGLPQPVRKLIEAQAASASNSFPSNQGI